MLSCSIKLVNREDLQGKKILTINEKYYVADHGLKNAVQGSNNDIDQILENIICLELLRRGYKVTVGRNVDKEIDFVVAKNNEKINIPDNYPKYVISLDNFNFSRDGIKHMNICDFLLDLSANSD